MINDSDSEDELPPGWREQVYPGGQVGYFNVVSGYAVLEHPVTGKTKFVIRDLPFGWKKEYDCGLKFVNTETGQKTAVDPRLAFRVEDTRFFRQRFDANSTCWDVLEGTDLTDKTVLVTGGSSGIGWMTALSLAAHGALVVFTTRNLKKSEADIKRALVKRPKLRLEAMYLDLLDLGSVREFAYNFGRRFRRLNVLILNAGIFGAPFKLSVDGLERTFQVNHLAQFYLYTQLERLLQTTGTARVVILTSESHRLSTLTRLEDYCAEHFTPEIAPKSWFPLLAYNDSKLLNLLFTRQLDRRTRSTGIQAYAVHPGNMIRTKLSRFWWFYKFIFFLASPFTKTLEQGAATTVFAAVSPDVVNCGSVYFNNCCICYPSKVALVDKLAEKLWDLSERILKDRRLL